MGNSTKEVLEILTLFERSDFTTLHLEYDGVRIDLAKDGHELPSRQVSQAVSLPLEIEPGAPSKKQKLAGNALAVEPSDPGGNASPPPPAPLDSNIMAVRAPMVGNFYSASSPGEPPFIKVGDQITEGTVVCLIECMKLFNSIEAGCGGTVVEIPPTDGQMVEFDQPLVLIRVH